MTGITMHVCFDVTFNGLLPGPDLEVTLAISYTIVIKLYLVYK